MPFFQRKQIVIFSEGESVSNQSIPGLWGDFTKAVKNLLVQIAIGLRAVLLTSVFDLKHMDFVGNVEGEDRLLFFLLEGH